MEKHIGLENFSVNNAQYLNKETVIVIYCVSETEIFN